MTQRDGLSSENDVFIVGGVVPTCGSYLKCIGTGGHMSTNSLDTKNNRASDPAKAQPSAGHASSPLTWWAAASFAANLGFSRISYGLLLPSIRMDLRGDYSAYGLIGTANFVGYLLGTLVVPL